MKKRQNVAQIYYTDAYTLFRTTLNSLLQNGSEQERINLSYKDSQHNVPVFPSTPVASFRINTHFIRKTTSRYN